MSVRVERFGTTSRAATGDGDAGKGHDDARRSVAPIHFSFHEEGAAAETAETGRAWGGDTYPRRAESAAAGRTVTV